FGASLYAQTGADGFSACPHDFLEGCAHEFVGRALVEHGTSFAETMVSICNASGTVEARCMHSIGHGVLGYFGYDTEALLQALLICGALEHTPWSSCGDGVFMEYSLRLLASGDSGGTLEVRPMDVDAP